MADSLEIILAKNIKVNLRDSTNYSAVAGNIKDVIIRNEFELLKGKTSVHAIIVIEEPEDEWDGISGSMFWLPVSIHIVYRRSKTPDGEARAIGVSGVDGLPARAKDVRQALNRESPYNDRKPSGSYTAQTGVLRAVYAGTEYRTEKDPGAKDVDVAKVTMRYMCVDTRSA